MEPRARLSDQLKLKLEHAQKPLLRLNRVAVFGEYSQASVVYLAPETNPALGAVLSLSKSIVGDLRAEGILSADDLKRQRIESSPETYRQNFHLTIAKQRSSFDARSLLSSQPIDLSVQTCAIGAYRISAPQDATYRPVFETN